MLLYATKGRLAIAAFSLIVACFFFWALKSDLISASTYSFETTRADSKFGPTNSTLGFGAIYVLTQDPETWRMQGLQKAAQVAGLQFEVVVREADEEYEKTHYKQDENGWGPIRCFLGHMDVLSRFAERSDVETALILEDDVDFGIEIKEQMHLLSNAIWDHASMSNRTEDEVALDPYRHSEWDLFWVGHWGMEFNGQTDVLKYRDPHALPWNRLHSIFNDYYSSQASTEPQQLIYNTAAIATYAYATTRSHAARIVQRYPDVFLKDAVQIDTSLHMDCKAGVHRCVAPVPALFQHQRVEGGTRIDDKGEEDTKQDLKWYQNRHKYTSNIEWSARCNAIRTGERVHDKWQCLPNPGDPT